VRAKCRQQGRGVVFIRIRWQTAESKWNNETRDRLIYAPLRPDDWADLIGVVTVPEESGRVLILLSMRGQSDENDVAWFDDVELYRLP